MGNKEPKHALVVSEGDEGKRLDIWLSNNISGLSRAKAKTLIANAEVTLNGKTAKKNALTEAGDRVEVWTDFKPVYFIPMPDDSADLVVLFQDEHLLAVDKPAGIPSTPLSPSEKNTLAGALVARFPECARIGRSPGDGGLIQRLDLETSGVILAGRSEIAYDSLLEIQNRNGIEKNYFAIVRRSEKELPKIVDVPLAPSGPAQKKMKPSAKGEPAATELALISICDSWMLVEATIFKGKRHQIRAHLAYAGFPIAGDTLYGGEPLSKDLPRLLLHAHRVRLNHPMNGKPLSIVSPIPPAFLKQGLPRP